MDDSLYLWIDVKKHLLVASGIELRDRCAALEGRKLLLLRPECVAVRSDPRTGFDCFDASELAAKRKEEVYSWGSYAWVDFEGRRPGALSKREISELLYMAYRTKAFGKTRFPTLRNHFLATGHDDGWYLGLYYNSQRALRALLAPLIERLDPPEPVGALLARLETGRSAMWLSWGKVEAAPRTYDIDWVLSSKWTPRLRRPSCSRIGRNKAPALDLSKRNL